MGPRRPLPPPPQIPRTHPWPSPPPPLLEDPPPGIFSKTPTAPQEKREEGGLFRRKRLHPSSFCREGVSNRDGKGGVPSGHFWPREVWFMCFSCRYKERDRTLYREEPPPKAVVIQKWKPRVHEPSRRRFQISTLEIKCLLKTKSVGIRKHTPECHGMKVRCQCDKCVDGQKLD